MRFYGGGLGYTELTNMPVTEFDKIIRESNEIAAAERREIEKAKG